MKKIFLILFLFITITEVNGYDRQKKTGIGIILGSPTGFSIKQNIESTSAIDGAIAWNFGSKASLHLHGDYLVLDNDLIDVRRGIMPVYYGIGARILFENENKVGIRFPLGISYLFENSQVELFLEIVPILNIAPATTFGMNGAIGGRYYF